MSGKAGIRRTSRAEMETVATWNRHDLEAGVALSTADPAEARRWARRGYAVEILGRYPGGEGRTWQTTIPLRALTFRRLPLPTRTATRRARFGEKPSSAAATAPVPSAGQPAGPVPTPGGRNPADPTRSV